MQQIHNSGKKLSKENLHQIKVKMSKFPLPAVLGLSSNARGGETAGLLGQQSALTSKQTQEEERGRDRVLMVRRERGGKQK